MTEPPQGTPDAAPAGEAPRRRPTPAAQWGALGILAAAFWGSSIAGEMAAPESTRAISTPWDCFSMAVAALAQGLWVTMDSSRLGRRVGGWRFAAIFFGPFGVWAYLAVACRRRALAWIPLSVAIYAVVFFFPAVIWVCFLKGSP